MPIPDPSDECEYWPPYGWPWYVVGFLAFAIVGLVLAILGF